MLQITSDQEFNHGRGMIIDAFKRCTNDTPVDTLKVYIWLRLFSTVGNKENLVAIIFVA